MMGYPLAALRGAGASFARTGCVPIMRLLEGEGWKCRAEGKASLELEARATPTPRVKDREKIMMIRGVRN